jgi:hypothetical protein
LQQIFLLELNLAEVSLRSRFDERARNHASEATRIARRFGNAVTKFTAAILQARVELLAGDVSAARAFVQAARACMAEAPQEMLAGPLVLFANVIELATDSLNEATWLELSNAVAAADNEGFGPEAALAFAYACERNGDSAARRRFLERARELERRIHGPIHHVIEREFARELA